MGNRTAYLILTGDEQFPGELQIGKCDLHPCQLTEKPQDAFRLQIHLQRHPYMSSSVSFHGFAAYQCLQ